jgi:glycosyltransferase involved in cell wall biosynthesis
MNLIKKFSVVIPVYDEEQSLVPLCRSTRKMMERLSEPYEIIFVNDGSRDKSLEVMRGLGIVSAGVVVVDLVRHSGKSAALQAGFEAARGEWIITMDADLQNDPEDIPGLLVKLGEGYDVVCGWRRNRRDPWRQRAASALAGALRRMFTQEPLHDVGCPFRIFRRSVLREVYLSGGLHRFFTLIVKKLGYRIAEVEVRHHPRLFGKTKFRNGIRLLEGIRDLLLLSFCDVRNLMRTKFSSSGRVLSGVSPMGARRR